jgi:hypothetical protein
MGTKNPIVGALVGSVAATVRHSGPDDPRLPQLRKHLACARLADQIHDAIPDAEVEAWAQRVAASLPPLTADEAAAVGRLAAELDARCGGGSGGA